MGTSINENEHVLHPPKK